MPIELTYTHDGAGVMYTGSGIVSGEELLRVNAEVYASQERVKKVSFIFCDLRKVTGTTISKEEIQSSVHQDIQAAYINPHIIAVILAEKAVLFGMARMWQSFAEDIPWKTFTTRDIAVARRLIADETGFELLA